MARSDVIRALIDHQGTLYSEAMGAEIARDTPQDWFHWLLGALLLSARISADKAVEAGAGLKAEGLHRIDGLLDAPRDERIRVLNRHGYARFDNRGADYIHAAAELVGDRYDGDLRRLPEGATTADEILDRLTEVKGIGPAGAEIFAREAQLLWAPLFPMTGAPAADAATGLGLPETPEELAQLAGGRERFVRLVAALTRAAIDGPAPEVEAAAGN